MKRIFLLLMFIVFFLSFAPLALAQTTCDLCGYCQGASPPQNWSQCASCIYSGTTDPNLTLLQTPDVNKAYTVFGCVATDAGGFTNFFMNFITSIVSGIGLLGIIYGGLQIMIARGDKERVQEGKRYVYGSILGILIVLFSVFAVKTIGGSLLKIPYLQ